MPICFYTFQALMRVLRAIIVSAFTWHGFIQVGSSFHTQQINNYK